METGYHTTDHDAIPNPVLFDMARMQPQANRAEKGVQIPAQGLHGLSNYDKMGARLYDGQKARQHHGGRLSSYLQ